ncbi:hypothetical protein IPH92_04095 [Candidatus Kaiserbacteria bacterium]|nr:MAG: hypothetical protein IPH92_04095 [Candidatus Kaiserbacteria bacterium]
MKNTFLRKIYSSLIAGLLVLSFVSAPVSQTLEVKKAEAIPVFDAAAFKLQLTEYIAEYGTFVQSTISAAADVAMAASVESIALKEYVLDGIVWFLINLILQEMIRSVTQWVASGFQGSPAFVSDLQGFLMDLADKVVGDFIYGSNLSFLCSPFKLNIQLALDLQYSKTRSYKAKCTLSGVVNNVSNFMEGDFLSGGWNEWFKMTQTPGNNQYGAYMEASVGLSATLQNAKGEEVKLLDFGKGLLSLKDDDGNIITPGTAIEATLNESLSIPGERLTIADEIDELIGTLFAQLAKTVLSAATGGLSGLSSTGKNSSYFPSVQAEAAAQGSTGGAVTLFSSSLSVLTEYIGYQNTIVSSINGAKTYVENSCYTTKSGNTVITLGTLDASLASQLTAASNAVTSATTKLNVIKQYESDYTALGASSTQALLAKYNATDSATAQQNLITQYRAYVASGALPTTGGNVDVKMNTIPNVQKEIQTFKGNVDTYCASLLVNP